MTDFDFSVAYNKIKQYSETRWSSLFFCIESIVKVKEALLAVKDDLSTDGDFAAKIPTAREFEALQDLLEPLSIIRLTSDELQADEKPTLHLVIPSLLNIANLSRSKSRPFHSFKPATKSFITAFETDLKKRIKDEGRREFLYCMAHYLHPGFKGAYLKTPGSHFYQDTEDWILTLFPEQEPQPSQSQMQKQHDSISNLSSPFIRGEQKVWGGLEELMDLNCFLTTESQEQLPEPKIKKEMHLWKTVVPMVKGSVDLLDFWKSQAKLLPLLSKLAQ